MVRCKDVDEMQHIADLLLEAGNTIESLRDRLQADEAITRNCMLESKHELIELAHSAWSMALCAMNGMPIPAEWGEAVEHGLRKYGIDVDNEKKVIEIAM